MFARPSMNRTGPARPPKKTAPFSVHKSAVTRDDPRMFSAGAPPLSGRRLAAGKFH